MINKDVIQKRGTLKDMCTAPKSARARAKTITSFDMFFVKEAKADINSAIPIIP